VSFDFAGIYGDIRQGLLSLAPQLTANDWATLAPATPEWTVKDLYAHLAGVAADVLGGNAVVPGTDEWTAKQVGDRADYSPEQVCAQWAETGPELETMMNKLGSALSSMVIDVWHHDQDARNAIGHHANRTGDGLRLALRTGNAIGPKVEEARLPTLGLSTEGYDRVFGSGEPEVVVSGDPYEMARAFMGRRSIEQIRGFAWEGDPEPYLPLFAFFPLRDTDLVE
jgi:uncharacterized protein (TIGR03083 family)